MREGMLAKMVKVILLNKKDLPDTTSVNQGKDLLRELHLWTDEPEDSATNPKIYESVALYEKKTNIFESFNDCAHRTMAHMV